MSMLPALSTAVTVTSKALPAMAVTGVVTTKWSGALAAGSPMAKSPREAIPVAWALVGVCALVVRVVQPPAAYCSTTTCMGSTPGSTSPGAKVNVAA